jgi:N-methylhydantoinase B
MPVFVDDRLAAWVVNTAHLIDLGGMQLGSFAPAATECYQEALRLPPVRLFAAGVERSDTWAILANNVRLPVLNEMDLRGLVAGCHVVSEKLISLITEKGGLEHFQTTIDAIRIHTDGELRHRIAQIADGSYTSRDWVEWERNGVVTTFRMQCTVLVQGNQLIFDYEGIAPQCPHHINSKPWIVQSELVFDVWSILAHDLPLNQALIDIIEVRCPPESLLNCEKPSPVGAGHADAAGMAVNMAMSCLTEALAASDEPWTRERLAAQVSTTSSATQLWRNERADGEIEAALMLDGMAIGSYGVSGQDGNDLSPLKFGNRGLLEFVQIEVIESWYSMLVVEKRVRPGIGGAGRWRAGAGCRMTFRPHGTNQLTGVMMAKRTNLPHRGMAGGMPGALTRLTVRRSNGQIEEVSAKADGVLLAEGDTFRFECSSGGGYGDPLDRDPVVVLRDILEGRVTEVAAEAGYGVLLTDCRCVDDYATEVRRAELRFERLKRAELPLFPVCPSSIPEERYGTVRSLFPGVEQRGGVAYAMASDTPLAVSPDHWTVGCAVLSEHRESRIGRDVVTATYLDPVTGRALMTDVRLDGDPRSFDSLITHWIEAAPKSRLNRPD